MASWGLIPFDEASRRLRLSRRRYLGIQEIPIDRIVGSVDRSADFDRDFSPRRGLSRSRLANLRSAFGDGAMPAIDVFEVGGAYFVEDGHHRVALARERGAEYIDAVVTRFETNFEVGPDVDVCQLVHTEHQRALLEESGLSRARPDADIEFTLLDHNTVVGDRMDEEHPAPRAEQDTRGQGGDPGRVSSVRTPRVPGGLRRQFVEAEAPTPDARLTSTAV